MRDRGVSRHEARHTFWKLALRFVDKVYGKPKAPAIGAARRTMQG